MRPTNLRRMTHAPYKPAAHDPCALQTTGNQKRLSLPPDLRIPETDGETEDLLLLGVNLPGLQVDAPWHADAGDVHTGVEATLGEDIDEHGQGSRVLEEQVLGID